MAGFEGNQGQSQRQEGGGGGGGGEVQMSPGSARYGVGSPLGRSASGALPSDDGAPLVDSRRALYRCRRSRVQSGFLVAIDTEDGV